MKAYAYLVWYKPSGQTRQLSHRVEKQGKLGAGGEGDEKTMTNEGGGLALRRAFRRTKGKSESRTNGELRLEGE